MFSPTSIYAAVLGFLAAFLTANVIVNRVRAKVDFGDGGVAALGQAIRAHANFAEHTPLALLLIGLVEAFGYPALAVNGLGIVLLLARLLSAFGLNSTLKQSFGRQTGASLTVLVTAVSAALIIYTVIPLTPRDGVTPTLRDGVTHTRFTVTPFMRSGHAIWCLMAAPSATRIQLAKNSNSIAIRTS